MSPNWEQLHYTAKNLLAELIFGHGLLTSAEKAILDNYYEMKMAEHIEGAAEMDLKKQKNLL
jgi:hypothetical protein